MLSISPGNIGGPLRYTHARPLRVGPIHSRSLSSRARRDDERRRDQQPSHCKFSRHPFRMPLRATNRKRAQQRSGGPSALMKAARFFLVLLSCRPAVLGLYTAPDRNWVRHKPRLPHRALGLTARFRLFACAAAVPKRSGRHRLQSNPVVSRQQRDQGRRAIRTSNGFRPQRIISRTMFLFRRSRKLRSIQSRPASEAGKGTQDACLNRPRGIRPHRNFDRSRAEHEIGAAAPCYGHKLPPIFPPRIQELSFLRILEAAAMQAFD